jgi:3-oxoacyl-(acyl-carrier-protein) synthase
MTSGVLTVLSQALSPVPGEAEPGPLPGFVGSSFSPLVAGVADRCLAGYFGAPPVDPARGERFGLVLATVRGDVQVARMIAGTVDAGRRMSPLLLFQSVANGVLGHVAATWRLGGPVVCSSPVGEPAADAMDQAADLIDSGDADLVLVLTAEQATAAGRADHATAALVCRRSEARHDDEESTP